MWLLHLSEYSLKSGYLNLNLFLYVELQFVTGSLYISKQWVLHNIHMILFGRKFVGDAAKFWRSIYTYLDYKITWVIEYFHEQSTKIILITWSFCFMIISARLIFFRFFINALFAEELDYKVCLLCKKCFLKKIVKNLFVCSLHHCKLTAGNL